MVIVFERVGCETKLLGLRYVSHIYYLKKPMTFRFISILYYAVHVTVTEFFQSPEENIEIEFFGQLVPAIQNGDSFSSLKKYHRIQVLQPL